MNGSEEAVGSSTLWPTHLQLSIVIPAYNEELRLEAGVARLLAAIESGAIDVETTEFVVVDDGSIDDTTPVARRPFRPLPLRPAHQADAEPRERRSRTGRGRGGGRSAHCVRRRRHGDRPCPDTAIHAVPCAVPASP